MQVHRTVSPAAGILDDFLISFLLANFFLNEKNEKNEMDRNGPNWTCYVYLFINLGPRKTLTSRNGFCDPMSLIRCHRGS